MREFLQKIYRVSDFYDKGCTEPDEVENGVCLCVVDGYYYYFSSGLNVEPMMENGMFRKKDSSRAVIL